MSSSCRKTKSRKESEKREKRMSEQHARESSWASIWSCLARYTCCGDRSRSLCRRKCIKRRPRESDATWAERYLSKFSEDGITFAAIAFDEDAGENNDSASLGVAYIISELRSKRDERVVAPVRRQVTSLTWLGVVVLRASGPGHLIGPVGFLLQQSLHINKFI